MTLLDDIGQPDLGLVTEVRSGRAEAFAELYRRHQPAVLRYALAMTRGDEARAQDLVSEAFVRVFDAVSAGRGSEVAFRPYVLAAVRNEYVTELRRFGRVDLVESPEQLDD